MWSNIDHGGRATGGQQVSSPTVSSVSQDGKIVMAAVMRNQMETSSVTRILVERDCGDRERD